MSRRKKRAVLAVSVLGVFVLAVLVFVLGFRVTAVKVTGNKFYTEDEIRSMILDDDTFLAGNSILAGFIRTEEKTKEANMIDTVSVSRQGRNTLVLKVKEKQLIGYVEYQGRYVNFDRQGIVQIITDAPVEDVPRVDGLEITDVQEQEKLNGVNSSKLNTILSVGKMLEKTAQKPDRLEFGTLNQLVLYYGDIEVRMGDDENMEEKMNRLEGILPELSGMKGILHMENVSENSRNVVFDQDTGAADSSEDAETSEGTEDGGSGDGFSGENSGTGSPDGTDINDYYQQGSGESQNSGQEDSYSENGSYDETDGYSEDGSYDGTDSYSEDGSYDGTDGYSEDGSYDGTDSYSEDGSYDGTDSYSEDGSYGGTDSYGEDGSYSGYGDGSGLEYTDGSDASEE